MEDIEEQKLLEEAKKKSIPFFEKSLSSMTLMEDYLFTAFMQDNKECMQVALRAFTQNDSIEVLSVKTQHVLKNAKNGRGVRYDSLVETKDGTIYEMEVENRPDKSLGLRLRYYGSMFDKEHLKKNEDFSKLPPYVNIVVMPKDIRKQNKPLYFVRRTFVKSQNEIGDDRAFFEDGEMIVLVNALYKNLDSYVGKVIHDFTTPIGEPKLIDEFENFSEKFLRTEEGRKKMIETISQNTYTMEDFDKTLARAELAFRRYQEAKQKMQKVKDEGIEIGRAEGRAEMNLQLMAMQQERERERQKQERLYNILIDDPQNDCEKKFFALAKHAIKVNKNYTEHNEKLAIRDLFKAGFSHNEISDTLEKNSPLVRDKSEIEKNIQSVAEKNKINSKSSAR